MIKSVTMGGSINVQNCLTSLMDDPLAKSSSFLVQKINGNGVKSYMRRGVKRLGREEKGSNNSSKSCEIMNVTKCG